MYIYRVCTEDDQILNLYRTLKAARAYRDACNQYAASHPETHDKWDVTHVQRWNEDTGEWNRCREGGSK